jgi:pimeloyl-ACP methyl ester carboxylesterase
MIVNRTMKPLPLKASCPTLFIYGKRKRTMFHTAEFEHAVASSEGSAVVPLNCGHFLMNQEPDAFVESTLKFLSS